MRTDTTFSINIKGEDSGDPYRGKFRVLTLLTRRDQFAADEVRRRILGIMAETAPPSLITEAYMIGQLQVRIIEGPDWWMSSEGGELLPDKNVVVELFKECMKAEEERKEKLKTDAGAARKRLRKKRKDEEEDDYDDEGEE
jgi:hypothetical protein